MNADEDGLAGLTELLEMHHAFYMTKKTGGTECVWERESLLTF
jgi:hypothetical protein